MKAEDYEALLFDPTDFMLRKYWPRVFGNLEPFKHLPPLHSIIGYNMGLSGFAGFGGPEMESALETLAQAAKQAKRMLQGAVEYAEKMKDLGFPPQAGSMTEAPFDMLSDFFRGTKLDVMRSKCH